MPYLSASSADLGKEICVICVMSQGSKSTTTTTTTTTNDHILGIYRLHRDTLVPDDDFGKMTIY